ncbi:MAG: VWA domain-containing protein, partial [Acidobacteria bacterium]|nr:VWA domain-containing protein [Acidobacteriota bacterium]
MKTDITVVLDRSGSMEPLAADVIGGLNAFVKTQQQVEGEAHFTLVQFDDEYEVVHFRVPVADVPRVTRRTYVPRGCTALL